MITLLSTLACVFSMTANWFVALGNLRVGYFMGIINGSCLVTLNSLIALSQPDQQGVFLLVMPSAWLVIASLIGIRRLTLSTKKKRD